MPLFLSESATVLLCKADFHFNELQKFKEELAHAFVQVWLPRTREEYLEHIQCDPLVQQAMAELGAQVLGDGNE